VAANGAGAALVRAIREGLPPGVELDEREEALLAAAAEQADALAALEKDIKTRGVQLTDEEVAELAELANVAKTRIGTPAEHYGPNYFPDRRAVEVYERVLRPAGEALL
jgi:hypothetical protein